MWDILDREEHARGEEARKRLQFTLLTTDHLDDAMAGLVFLKGLPDVDPRRSCAAMGWLAGCAATNARGGAQHREADLHDARRERLFDRARPDGVGGIDAIEAATRIQDLPTSRHYPSRRTPGRLYGHHDVGTRRISVSRCILAGAMTAKVEITTICPLETTRVETSS